MAFFHFVSQQQYSQLKQCQYQWKNALRFSSFIPLKRMLAAILHTNKLLPMSFISREFKQPNSMQDCSFLCFIDTYFCCSFFTLHHSLFSWFPRGNEKITDLIITVLCKAAWNTWFKIILLWVNETSFPPRIILTSCTAVTQ